VSKDKNTKKLSVPEPFLRRISETVTASVDMQQAANRKSIFLLDTSPMAFGELLQFMYHGKTLDDKFGREYLDIDKLNLAIEVCGLADK